MVVVAALGGAAFLIVSLLGGARLLGIARRTRGLPEVVLGSSLFFMGGLGAPLALLAKAATFLPEPLRLACYVGHALVLTAGMGGLALFTWRVFRAGEAWARWLTLAITAALALCWLVSLAFEGGRAALADEASGIHVFSALTLVPLGWAAFESTRYALRLRRRVAVGLADPVVANRMLLWGVAIGVGSGLSAATAFDRLLGADLVASAVGLGSIGTLALVGAGALCLAFLPPRVYTAWVQRRAAAPTR
jgi:hypothetical protein